MKNRVTAIILILSALYSGYMLFKIKSDKRENPEKNDDFITILWADWAPANYLEELVRGFTEETGIRVEIIKDSWSNLQNVFFTEAEFKSTKFDMVIGDSQWLGRGSMEGHYVHLTKWMKDNNVDKSMTEKSISGYSEFPKGSGRYWAVPFAGDAMAFSYRKDLFENTEEKHNFREKYGYELDVPENWIQLRDIAEFFYRPEDDLYGILVWNEPEYDGITMGIQAFLWGWGADLGNYKNYKVKGFLNSEKGIKALEYYRELNRFNNPEWKYNYLDSRKSSNTPMMKGEVAMAMCYLSIAPDLLDPEKNSLSNEIGFFAAPAGPEFRATSLGGQGISVVSYSRKKYSSFKFLEWIIREDVQEKWSELGGLSCNKNILDSEKWISASPVNRTYRESIVITKDFWTVPEYPELLSVSQKYWDMYINNDDISAEEAMMKIEDEWEEVFEQAGYYKE